MSPRHRQVRLAAVPRAAAAVTSASSTWVAQVAHDVHVEGERLPGGDRARAAGRRRRSPAGTPRAARRSRPWARGRGRAPTRSPRGGRRRSRTGRTRRSGRYLRRRSVSMCRRTTAAWYAWVAARHSSKVGVVGRAARAGRTAARCSAWVRPSRSQSRSGQRSGSQKSALGRHRLRAELGHEAGHPGQRRGGTPGKSRSWPWYQPK